MSQPRKDPAPLNPWFLAKFFCWAMAVLAPTLTWINGPSVSADQFVVRTTVFCMALGDGIGLSVAKLLGRKGRNGDAR